ncbi:MAG: NTP transferase domain-containing protein [Candidatus Baldrarchaeia archaeon]
MGSPPINEIECVILAAGKGERLGEISKYIPKPLIPIANRPLISYVIENVRKMGIREITVVAGKNYSKLLKLLSDNNGIRVIRAGNFEKGPLFTFLDAEPYIERHYVLILPCDLVADFSFFSEFIRKCNMNFQINLAVCRKRQPLGSMKIIPARMALISKDFFMILHKAENEGYKRVIDAIMLAEQLGIGVNRVPLSSAKWVDVDTISDLLRAHKFVLERIPMPSGAACDSCLDRVLLIKPLIIGRNITFSGPSVIGPYVSIGDNATIGDSTFLTNVIVMAGAQVGAGLLINNAVIYRDRIFRDE